MFTTSKDYRVIAEFLCDIFNLSLATGVFPVRTSLVKYTHGAQCRWKFQYSSMLLWEIPLMLDKIFCIVFPKYPKFYKWPNLAKEKAKRSGRGNSHIQSIGYVPPVLNLESPKIWVAKFNRPPRKGSFVGQLKQ